MRICLLRPPVLIPRSNVTEMFTPPLGLAYVAASLREAGHQVEAIDSLGIALDRRTPMAHECDLLGLSIAEVVARIPPTAAMIGISVQFSFEWPLCRELIGQVRARFPEAFLFAGGEHVTALPEESLTESALDAVVLGEGEATAVALAEAVRQNQSLGEVTGIAFKDADSTITVTPRRPRITAIDAIPRPAWELLPIEAYLDRQVGFGVNRGRSMPMLASRGCPYQCTFCSSPAMWTTRWDARAPEQLLDEIESYQATYSATNFDFYDLTTIIKKEWIKAFCRAVLARGLTITWQLPSGTRLEAIDQEVAALLYASGCRNLSFSPESGSPAVLDRIKKRIQPKRCIDTVRMSVKAGLNVKVNLIFGFPGETYREVAESLWFIVRIALAGAHDLSVWGFSPYPGSAIFNQLLSTEQLQLDDAYYDSLRSYADPNHTMSSSEHLSDRALRRLRLLGQSLFYIVSWLRRPGRPVLVIRNWWAGIQHSRGDMVLQSKLNRWRPLRLLRTAVRSLLW